MVGVSKRRFLEEKLGRVINLENSGKERNKLTKSIVKAIRELMNQQATDLLTHDLAAFIALSLEDIHQTVDVSVLAWEKRGYWLKADRFRLDWEWSEQYGKQMREAVLSEDWASIANLSAKVAQKLSKIQIAAKNRIGEPWIGSWDKIRR
jgi:hypothetical protein